MRCLKLHRWMMIEWKILLVLQYMHFQFSTVDILTSRVWLNECFIQKRLFLFARNGSKHTILFLAICPCLKMRWSNSHILEIALIECKPWAYCMGIEKKTILRGEVCTEVFFKSVQMKHCSFATTFKVEKFLRKWINTLFHYK